MIADLISALRRAPFGILLIAAGLTISGVGLFIAGTYLLLREGSLSIWAGAVSILMSPAILYFVYHVVHLERWTWICLAVLIALLVVSSLFRAAFTPEVPTAALMELALEVAAAAYLLRPTVRSQFGWLRTAPEESR